MKKETRGRKPALNPASVRLELRLTPQQKTKYLKAATKENMSLSSWLKFLADSNT